MATAPAKTPKPETDKQKREDVAHGYGYNVAFMNSDPELKKLFAAATAAGPDGAWGQAQFTAALQNTKWFKTHSSAYRQAQFESLSDGDTFKAKTATIKADAQDRAAKMGAVLTGAQLDKFVHNVQWLGWDDSQQANFLSNYVSMANSGPLKGQYLGAAGQNADALRATAQNNGYTMTDAQLQKWNQAITSGSHTVGEYQDFMRRQAANMFPTFADEILAGQDASDVAHPYTQAMADTLELDPGSITLKDPTIRKALSSPDPKTGKPTAMGIGDFETSLRQDPRWMKTDQAHTQIVGTGVNVLRSFGLMA